MTETGTKPLTIEDFEPHRGEGFVVTYPDHREVLTLVETSRRRHSAPGREGGQFVLEFKGESPMVRLGDLTHLLHHPVLGPLELFLVARGRNPDGTHTYQATFN